MEETIRVTQSMADFIQWANDKGEDEIRRLIRERLAMLKEECAKTDNHTDADGFKWDDALEPNDGVDQWKHGGDCNLCRKAEYCGAQCRSNKLLKKITTSFLYKCYLEENPETAVKESAGSLLPEDVVKELGIQ